MSTLFSGEKPKLLYVDDERANLTAFRVLLRDQYHVLTAETAEDAYHLLREHDIPLVVSDQRMPGMTGTELLAKVASDFPDCARMILTGYSDIDAVIDGINRSQIYYYFKKPWNENEVRLTLENALEYVLTRRRLVASEQRFRSTFEQAGVGIAHVNPDGTIVRANSRLQKFLSVSEAELTGRPISAWFSGITADDLAHMTVDGSTAMVRETSVPTDKGNRWGRVAFTAPQGNAGNADHFIVVVDDLTERKQAEADLAAVASEWQNTFNSVNDVIWILDAQQRIVRSNGSAETVLGVKPEDIIMKPCREAAGPCTIPDQSCPLERMKQTLTRETTEMIMGDKTYWVSVDPILDATGNYGGAVHIISDISARKQIEAERDRLEEHLRQTQKLEAIGSLAGGIAHDFNNLLTPIIVYAEIIDRKLAADDALKNKAQGITKAALSAKQLTSQLLTFGRKQVLDMKACNLNEVIASFHDVLRRTIRENIQIDLRLAPRSLNVMADRGQLVQIILNLIVNAQDAIEANGTVTMETSEVLMDGEIARRHPGMIPGRFAMLAVADTGTGMEEGVLEHIFEPFYTTKQIGRGTGLGLATVYGIIKQHDGFVDVSSRPGKGTVFRIYLPLAAAQGQETEASSSGLRGGRSVGGTILVVDDNDMVRELLTEILNEAGYSTIVAATPHEALDIVRNSESQIAMLLTDIVMPDMNGNELYGRLSSLRPEIKVMYISGYANKVSVHGGYLEEGVNFLSKPFTSEALLERVQKLM